MIPSALFSGMNVHNMNVHINPQQQFQQPSFNPYYNQAMLESRLLPQVSYAPEIKDENNLIVEVENVMYKFDKTHIDDMYVLHFNKSFDSVKPRSKYTTLNPHYVVMDESDDIHNHDDRICATIVLRKDNDPILTILDIDHIEPDDRYIVDQMLYNICLFAKINKRSQFFLILEKSGPFEKGCPTVSRVHDYYAVTAMESMTITF